MEPVALPSGLKTARLVAYVQGAIGIFTGFLFVIGGAGFATALGLSGGSGTAAVVSAGVVLAAVSGLLIWFAALLGLRSPRARVAVLVFEYLSLILGILTLSDVWQAALRIVLAVVVIYYLQVDRETRAVFGAASPTVPRRPH